MGAIYLDQGYNFVNRLLINNIFVKYLKLETLLEAETDFKSRLIEWCQKNHHTIEFVTENDLVLLKGSNSMELSKIVPLICKNTDESKKNEGGCK
jgi:dsRNA-specific ribonuclease